jgi:hypothetical protein
MSEPDPDLGQRPKHRRAEPGPGSAAGSQRWVTRGSRARTILIAAITSLGLIGLLGGTLYTLVLRPRVEDVLVGKSRLKVAVLEQGQFTPRGLPHSGMFLFQDGAVDPGDVPPGLRDISAAAKRNTWALAHGAVPAETLALRLTIRAAGDTPVILQGLRVDDVKRSTPLAGWFVVPDTGCGGQPVRTIDLDFDREPMTPMLSDPDPDAGGGGGARPKPFDETYRVTQSDPEVFEIHARSLKHTVSFKLVLLYDSESGNGELPVNDGKPFTVTALAKNRAKAYEAPFTSEDTQPEAPLERAPSRDPSASGPVGLC